MKKGMYVRCPIIREEGDERFPRYFVLGQVVKVDDFTETVTVRFHDLFHSKQFYGFVFEQTVFDLRQVTRCTAPVGCHANWSGSLRKVVAVEKATAADDFVKYYLDTPAGVYSTQIDHSIRSKSTSQSSANRPVVPFQTDQSFR